MDMADLGNEIFKDPYEFATEDSQLWLRLFTMVKPLDKELFYKLMYLRGTGATLEKNADFGYVIKPIIDRSGLHGWLTEKQYNEEKQCLRSHTKTLIGLLKKL